MTRYTFNVARSVAMSLCVLISPSLALCAPAADASPAPAPASASEKGFSLVEDSKSPCGRYGIAVPDFETFEKGQRARLVTLKDGRVIYSMKNADYFVHQNHGSIHVSWQQQGKRSLCLVVCNAKWDASTVALLEIGAAGDVNEIDLWSLFQKGARPLISAAGLIGTVGTGVKFVGTGRIEFSATAFKTPKEPSQIHDRLVVGSYDVRSHSLTMKPLSSVGSAHRNGYN